MAKLRIASHAGIWCVYVPYIHNPGVHGRFYELNIKKEMVILENKSCWSPEQLKKRTADS